MNLAQFELDEVVFDAVMHNLMIIGEASNHISDATQQQMPSIEWRKITGLRNIIAHEYFGIDTDIIWDVVQNKVPELLLQLRDAGIPGEK